MPDVYDGTGQPDPRDIVLPKPPKDREGEFNWGKGLRPGRDTAYEATAEDNLRSHLLTEHGRDEISGKDGK